MVIRPVDIDIDGEALAKLASWIFRAPITGAEMKSRYERFPPHKPKLRIVAEVDGELAGYVRCNYWGEDATMYQSTLAVDPRFQRQGIGAALLETVEAFVAENGGKSLLCSCYEDEPHSLRFAEKNGFGLSIKLHYLTYDLSQAKPLDRDPEGITLVSFAEADPSTRDDHIFDVFLEADQDVPGVEDVGTFDRISYDSMVLKNPNLSHQASFMAFDGDRAVGVINLMLRDPRDTTLYETDFTGVRRACRGRGIATALKQKALYAAKQLGGIKCLTANASTNGPMLATNLRAGFTVEHVSCEVVKRYGGAD